MIKKKTPSIIFSFVLYTFAFIAAAVLYNRLIEAGPIKAMIAADVLATLIVWIAGLIVNNASTYDPYWSVAPPLIALGWVSTSVGFNSASVLLVIALIIWSVRLTLNFFLGWPGLTHQDWRYGMLKDKNPKLWLVTNLFGINLFPTLIVFVCMIPAYLVIQAQTGVSLLVLIGFVMCIGAAVLQFIADGQMRAFRNTKAPGTHIESGLWRLSRHPNYLGEVTLWWGIWVMQMGVNPSIWLTVLAPIAMTAMFLYISIPMMETHVAEKCPEYTEYQKRVGVLLPRFGRKEAYDEARG